MEKKIMSSIGYPPDECPLIWKLLLYAIQQVIVMFPATVAVALITGFHFNNNFCKRSGYPMFYFYYQRTNSIILWLKFLIHCSMQA